MRKNDNYPGVEKQELLLESTRRMLNEALKESLIELERVQNEEIASIQETIDMYVSQGKLHGKALEMALCRLEEIKKEFSEELKRFNDSELH